MDCTEERILFEGLRYRAHRTRHTDRQTNEHRLIEKLAQHIYAIIHVLMIYATASASLEEGMMNGMPATELGIDRSIRR
jgi:hypothetical protein